MIYKIVITGATSGLGYELAKLLLADNKHYIVGMGRNREKLDELGKYCADSRKYKGIQCDFHIKEDIINSVKEINEFESIECPIYLVHCAGHAYPSSVRDLSSKLLIESLQTNLIAPIEFTRKILETIENSRILLIADSNQNRSLIPT